MRRMIFHLTLLLLVIVLAASLGTPGVTASTPPVAAPHVSPLTGEYVIIQRSAVPTMLQGSALFDSWRWFGTNTRAATSRQAGWLAHLGQWPRWFRRA